MKRRQALLRSTLPRNNRTNGNHAFALLVILVAPFCYAPISVVIYQHYYLPLNEWMATGRFAWQILLGPLAALLVIACLCQIARHNRKR